jgi:hypothetical protein
MDCRKCGRAVVSPATGRPRVWCSDGCRRAADYEVRRIVRRLERLEDALPTWRTAVDRGRHPRGGSLKYARERLADLDGERIACEQRLALLLDGEGDGGR